jgi:predicted ArsR family transcriptional regulator
MVYGSTREEIVHLLQRGPSTVEEVAQSAGLTPNAVRSHLATLGRDGLVERMGFRKGSGRPARLYRLTQKALNDLSEAHRPFLAALVRVLAQELPSDRVRELLVATGRSLAPSLPPEADYAARRKAALAALRGLGADVEAIEDAGALVIKGFACPLGDAVRSCPDVCHAVGALLEDVLHRKVASECRHDGRPACRFRVR